MINDSTWQQTLRWLGDWRTQTANTRCNQSLRRSPQSSRRSVVKFIKVKKVKGKGRHSSSWEPRHRVTGRNLPYGTTRSERTPPNLSHAGWYSIYLLRMDGRLSWPSWLDSAPAGSRTSDLSITSPTPNRSYSMVIKYDQHPQRQLRFLLSISMAAIFGYRSLLPGSGVHVTFMMTPVLSLHCQSIGIYIDQRHDSRCTMSDRTHSILVQLRLQRMSLPLSSRLRRSVAVIVCSDDCTVYSTRYTETSQLLWQQHVFRRKPGT